MLSENLVDSYVQVHRVYKYITYACLYIQCWLFSIQCICHLSLGFIDKNAAAGIVDSFNVLGKLRMKRFAELEQLLITEKCKFM